MNRTFGPAALVFAALILIQSSPAAAFCGFYVAGGDAKLFNEATQVVMMRHGNQTALSMQNNYQGPTEDFAMVVPVPQVLQKENVKTLEKAVFDKIDRLTAPRLVEYWERDPCFKPEVEEMVEYEASAAIPKTADEGAVVVEAQFQVGEYDVVVLSANESTALDKYLRQEKYNIPDGAEPYFKPYIESGMYFFVAKVNKKKVKFENGRAVLSPLRFHYESDDFQLPIRLGMINSAGKQDLIVYILAPGQRYEVANYENAFIPTNIAVQNDVRDRFGEFYRALFDRTLEKNPKSVITEYSWDASGCDPCPGPALQGGDYETLGADVLGAGGGWVITRLHARYGKEDIGEDLVFRAAEPVSGGREWRNEDGALVQGARPSSRNMFQGRYIIRHEWTGDVDCEDPQFGVWGGKNGGAQPRAGSAPSANTEGRSPNFDAAEKVSLPALVKEAVPSLGVKPERTDSKPSPPETSEKPVPDEGPKSTCAGCSAANGTSDAGAALLLMLALVGLRRRR